jgi:hypothetical protein
MSRRESIVLVALAILGTAIAAFIVLRHTSREITQLQLDQTFEIQMLEFNNFKKDVGRYPDTYNEMITPGNIVGWKGPYFLMAVEKQLFNLKGDDLIFKNGIQFRYSKLHNGHELRSPGLDGRYYTSDDTVQIMH